MKQEAQTLIIDSVMSELPQGHLTFMSTCTESSTSSFGFKVMVAVVALSDMHCAFDAKSVAPHPCIFLATINNADCYE